MRLFLALLAAAIGTAITVALIALYGAAGIGAAISGAGWGLLLLIPIHLVQTAFSALGWRALLPPLPYPTLFRLRWIREAVNGLLPVAQIGGDVVRARLLNAQGVPLPVAGASVTVDLTVEITSQIIFTLLGLGLLIRHPEDIATVRWLTGATVAAAGVVFLFLLTQRLGGFHLVERLLVAGSGCSNWKALGDVNGLHAAIAALYCQPAALALSFLHHLIAWLLGGAEVMVALALVGVPVGLADALVIESLGLAAKSVGFAVPGALGVQEGGFILVCGLVGIDPAAAIELSLLKRIREVLLGIPGLVAWQVSESRSAVRRGRAAARARPSEMLP